MSNIIELYPSAVSKEDCNTIIELFKNEDPKNLRPGCVGNRRVDHEIKISTDLSTHFYGKHPELAAIIYPALVKGVEDYIEKYPALKIAYHGFTMHPNYNIQYYKDGEGYSAYHCEYAPYWHTEKAFRVLAWQLNLNDAECGTEFMIQKQTISANAGQLSIWPAYWTHTHRGVCPNIGDKYIATGWFLYRPITPDNAKTLPETD